MPKHTVSTKGGARAAAGHKSRRAALRALAGVSALAVSTISAIADALPDPIFIAIERHKAAYIAREATSFALDDSMNNPEAGGVSDAEWDAYDRARAAEDAAFDELLMMGAPKTAAGMRATIAHLISLDDGRLSRKMTQLLSLLLKSSVLAS
jgi:hypothetical protein